MRERQNLESQIGDVERLEKDLADQIELIELAEGEGDETVVAESETALKLLAREAGRLQLESMLSGEADSNDAYLEVHAGAGGTESQDWAQMLMRMYTRWAEKSDYKVELLEIHDGEEQIVDAFNQGAERLWLAEGRIGRSSAGTDISVRQPGPEAHFVC